MRATLNVRFAAILAAGLFTLTPVSGRAQFATPGPVTSQDRVDNFLANAAIGAVVGGVRAVVTQRSIRRGFVRGAIGGFTLGAAKQVAASEASAAGLLGRTINAVGIATIASATIDTLSVLVPFGPFLVEVVPRSSDRVRPRLNMWTAAIATASLLDSRARLDTRASLNAGAFVFETDGESMPWGSGEAGFAHPGVIFVSFLLADRPQDRALTIRHESVHILQWDAYHALVTRPVERAAVGRLRGGEQVNRYVEFHVLAPLTVWGIASRVADEQRPWEREAYRLTGESPQSGDTR